MAFDPTTATLGAFDPSTATLHEDLTPEEIQKRARQQTVDDMSGGEQALAAAGGGFLRAGTELAKPGAGIIDLFRAHPLLAMSALGNPAMLAAAVYGNGKGAAGDAVDARLAAQDAQDAPLKAAAPVSYGVGASAPLLAAPELAPARALGLAGRLGGVFDMAANASAQGAGSAALGGDDIAAGAAGGALAGPLAAGAGNIVAKGLNAAHGAVDPAVLALQAKAQAAGIPLTIGDLGSNAWSQVEAFLKHTPLSGMRAVREKQAKGMIGAATDLGTDLTAGAPAQDLEQAVAESAQREYARRAAEQDRLYAQVPSDAKVTTHETTPALFQLLDQYGDVLDKSGASKDTKDLVSKLLQPAQPTTADLAIQKFYGKQLDDPNVVAQIEKANPGFADRLSGKAPLEPTELSVGDLHTLRKKLGNVQRAMKQQVNSGTADADALAAVNDVRSAIDNDFDTAGNQVGPLLKNATAYSRDQIMPYRNNKILADLLDSGEGQGLLGKVSQKGNRATADLVMNNIGPEGQAALQAGLYDKLLGPGVGDHLKAGYSPSRLLNALDIGGMPSQNRAANQVFSPKQLSRISDLRDLTGATRDAAGYAAETAGGAKLLPYYIAKLGNVLGAGAAGAGLLGGHALVAAPFAAGRMAKAFTTSPRAQRWWYARGGQSELLNNLGAESGASLFDQLSQ
jgi:hypothetical protein